VANLTPLQATHLADNFLDLAKAIGDFRYNNWYSLTDEEKQNLAALKSSIMNYGEDILALSTTLIMDDVQTSLGQINNITSQIKGTIQTLHNIQKGFDVASSIVNLGAAIISLNPQSVVKAIGGVINAWNS
jgi:hypothetical protein